MWQMTLTRRELLLLTLTVAVQLAHGRASAQGLATTPPMGWNSWNHYRCNVSDALIRAQADAMLSSGMKAAGYQYVNIDDCWEGERDTNGYIHPNSKFPDMKALADYVHGKGLKLGIYSSPGPKTCGKYEGSYGHEQQDAEMYAKWGIDYLKYDWCSAANIYQPNEYPAAIRKMHDALVHAGRPIVYSIHGRGAVWEWAAAAGANLWRTTGDISDLYARMIAIGFGQSGLEKFAGPGHWNDPDYLVPNAGMTASQAQSQFTLWAILAAPLVVSADLMTMPEWTRRMLLNQTAIGIDQNPRGLQAHLAFRLRGTEAWVKPLSGQAAAVAVLNQAAQPAAVRLTGPMLGFPAARSFSAVDVWAGRTFVADRPMLVSIAPETAVLLRVVARRRGSPAPASRFRSSQGRPQSSGGRPRSSRGRARSTRVTARSSSSKGGPR